MRVSSLAILLFCTTSLLAQSPVEKGTYKVGGALAFSTISPEEGKSQTSFIFSPDVGYFFVDNFFTGIAVNYNYMSFGDDRSTSVIGIGPKLRYFLDANEKVKPFFGASYAYSLVTYTDDDENSQTALSLHAGIDFFITNYFALEGSLNYSFVNQEYESNNFTSDHDLTMFTVEIGASYFIN